MSEIFVDNIKHQSSQGSGTITLGASGETIALASGASVTGNGLVGITMADGWRLTANTNTSTNADVTTNWERMDTYGYESIGTGLTESSGIFSFPQTGTYWINYVARYTMVAGDASSNLILQVTTDNSNYNITGYASAGNGGSVATNGNGSNNAIINVTDITTHKFKFTTSSFDTGTSLSGITSNNRTHFIAIRLGDST